MVTVAQIKWGYYNGFEGPFFAGIIPYVPESNPDFLGKVVQTVCATEGGKYDAVNMYDQCVVSIGILQVCEKILELSNMLSLCARTNLDVINGELAKLPAPLELRAAGSGPMRMFMKGTSDMVADVPTMRKVYLGGSTGLKGQWTEPQKTWAKQVAVVFANMWQNEDLQRSQLEYVKGRMFGFALPRARTTILANPNKNGWAGAVQAGYLSYAANLPAIADRCLANAMADSRWLSANDETKFHILMQAMVKSGVDIWPGRYRHIADTLSALFGVRVPTLESLTALPNAPALPPQPLISTTDIQRALIQLGYDLGPAGADGVYGNKTKLAVIAFQAKNGLEADGIVGPATKAKLAAAIGGT